MPDRTMPRTKSRRSAASIALAFFAGLYLALLQYAYYFLLEAFLSSQHVSYFVSVLFWLIGFLVGLNLRSLRLLPWLLGLSLVAYYLAWALIQVAPFESWLYPVLGACIGVSAMLAGYFFSYASNRFERVKGLFFHENNVFVLGLVISLLASICAGRWYLDLSPLFGAASLAIVMIGETLGARVGVQAAAPGDGASEPGDEVGAVLD